MSQGKIDRLTPEQEAMMPVYEEKWWNIATSTASLDRSQATKAVLSLYELIEKEEPDIIFVESPASAWKHILSSNLLDCVKELEYLIDELHEILVMEQRNRIWDRLEEYFCKEIETRQIMAMGVVIHIFLPLNNQVNIDIELENSFALLGSENYVGYGSFLDYCISELNCEPDGKSWDVYQGLLQNAGWIFPFEKTCIVCSRPTIVSVDDGQRLHAEGGPALQYADGLSVYAHHGVELPEKYGKLHPHQWRSQWILEEKNAEVRRGLIAGIGYGRMVQELQAIALDSWQEYTLLRIDGDVDVEPILLLKMTCPSTGFIHVLRVPPDVESAREAIRWVNWGISPDEFQAQS